MNQSDFTMLFEQTVQDIEKLLIVKGGEYAGSTDRLANFKRGAALTGVSPLTVLMIYMSKHYDAFSTYVRDQEAGVERPRSEAITGRLHDIINYCILAIAMIEEKQGDTNKSVPEFEYKVTYADAAGSAVRALSRAGDDRRGSPGGDGGCQG